MKISFYLLITILIFTTSCVGFFETAETSSRKENTQTKQQKAEATVENHIIKSFDTSSSYKGFKFGELYTLKPKEIVELDQLYELRKVLPSLEENYPGKLDSVITANDTAIIKKKRELKKKNIYPTYELNHIYKITTKNNIIKLYECKFTLFPNYKIKNVQITLNTELDKKEDELFYYFIMQYPLYEFENELTTKRYNENTYNQFNIALENETENKARLLKTILSICRYIRINNNFNETKISKTLAKEWILNNNKYRKSYKSISFSELLPIDQTVINDENEPMKIPLGYQLNHKFEYIDVSDTLIQKNIDFRFDLNFVITNVEEIKNDEKP